MGRMEDDGLDDGVRTYINQFELDTELWTLGGGNRERLSS